MFGWEVEHFWMDINVDRHEKVKEDKSQKIKFSPNKVKTLRSRISAPPTLMLLEKFFNPPLSVSASGVATGGLGDNCPPHFCQDGARDFFKSMKNRCGEG